MSDEKMREAIKAIAPTCGPCLIPREGSNMPSCHERDFCQCDMEEAYLAGQLAERERVKPVLEAAEFYALGEGFYYGSYGLTEGKVGNASIGTRARDALKQYKGAE